MRNEKNRLEAIEAVDKINGEMILKYGEDFTAPMVSVTFCEDYIFFKISLPESQIDVYLNEDAEDDRIYYEESNSYESYYNYIRRKFVALKDKIFNYDLY